MHLLNKFPSPKAFQDLLRAPANMSHLQAFLHEEFNSMCRVNPAVQFFYSVEPKCCNLTTSNRISKYEWEHIEADTAIFFIYSRIRQSDVYIWGHRCFDSVCSCGSFTGRHIGYQVLTKPHLLQNTELETVIRGHCTTPCSQWIRHYRCILWSWQTNNLLKRDHRWSTHLAIFSRTIHSSDKEPSWRHHDEIHCQIHLQQYN